MESIIKQLNEKAKTTWEIKSWIENSESSVDDKEWIKRVDKKWVSVEDVTAVLAGKVLIDQKQLTERLLEIDKPSNDYAEVCRQNREYRILLKELMGEKGSGEGKK